MTVLDTSVVIEHIKKGEEIRFSLASVEALRFRRSAPGRPYVGRALE